MLMLFACWNLSSIDLYTERSTVIWYWLFWNIPMAFCFPPIQQIGFNEVPREKLNLVSCAQNVSRLLAGSIGTAIAVTIMERRAESYFDSFGRYLELRQCRGDECPAGAFRLSLFTGHAAAPH